MGFAGQRATHPQPSRWQRRGFRRGRALALAGGIQCPRQHPRGRSFPVAGRAHAATRAVAEHLRRCGGGAGAFAGLVVSLLFGLVGRVGRGLVGGHLGGDVGEGAGDGRAQRGVRLRGGVRFGADQGVPAPPEFEHARGVGIGEAVRDPPQGPQLPQQVSAEHVLDRSGSGRAFVGVEHARIDTGQYQRGSVRGGVAGGCELRGGLRAAEVVEHQLAGAGPQPVPVLGAAAQLGGLDPGLLQQRCRPGDLGVGALRWPPAGVGGVGAFVGERAPRGRVPVAVGVPPRARGGRIDPQGRALDGDEGRGVQEQRRIPGGSAGRDDHGEVVAGGDRHGGGRHRIRQRLPSRAGGRRGRRDGGGGDYVRARHNGIPFGSARCPGVACPGHRGRVRW
ncbi:hypothetical protein [Nocardia wallacei]|uniref:hypothetical protein n=1 Tax=Nocardia wallacei TaxID=480035 RepID=UPI0024572E31|nr:hypothetical protein [Nocardia wallacei]